jgi:pimeloyl-ACP methyl ester carboxylesterase
MARPVLFVHGGGEGAHQEDAALAASLADALGPGYRVVYPPMPEAADATAADWTRRIAEAAAELGDGAALVGHSIGATLLLAALADAAPGPAPWPRAAGAFLVAAPFVGPGGWEIDFALPADLGRRLPPGVPLVFYHSPHDTTVPFAHAGLYARELPGAVFRRLDGRDHQFNEDLAAVAADIRQLGPV